MISELFLQDLLLIKTNGKLIDQNDFFSALYEKQESWREPLGSRFPPLGGKYTPNHNVGNVKINNITIDSWLEFQQFITDAYTHAAFIPKWVDNLSATDLRTYLTNAGIYDKSSSTTTLTASNGTVLATGLDSPTAFATSWNTLRVSYERNTVKDAAFQYIKFIETYSSRNYFRKSTFNFDGTA